MDTLKYGDTIGIISPSWVADKNGVKMVFFGGGYGSVDLFDHISEYDKNQFTSHLIEGNVTNYISNSD